MTNINIDESIRELPRVINGKNTRRNSDVYSRYSSIYMAPTSNVRGTVGLLDTKRINNALVVGSTGAYICELLLNGVKNIDAFDINVYQYFYYELLMAGIRAFDYEDFVRFFCSVRMDDGKSQDFFFTFDGFEMDYLIPDIKGPARVFWEYIMAITENPSQLLLNGQLFRKSYITYPEHLEKFSSVYDMESFDRLKNILLFSDYNIDYRILGIDEVPEAFQGKKYDLISFDNILQYYNRIQSLNNVYKVDSFIKDDISNMLNDDGVCQVDYGFVISSSAVSKMLKRERPNLSFKDTVFLDMNKRIINKETKEGIIPLLIKKRKDDYSLDFIRGVEEDDYSGMKNAENVVLSYVKTKSPNDKNAMK